MNHMNDFKLVFTYKFEIITYMFSSVVLDV